MTNNQKILQLTNMLALERQCADQLFEALYEGGVTRAFEAMRFHELTRNGMIYGGATLPTSPEGKKKKPRRHPQHPTFRWARPDEINKDFWIKDFNCEPFKILKPKENPEEDNQ